MGFIFCPICAEYNSDPSITHSGLKRKLPWVYQPGEEVTPGPLL